jgi:hypothetical protein
VGNLRWRICCLLSCHLNDRSLVLGEYRAFVQIGSQFGDSVAEPNSVISDDEISLAAEDRAKR